MLWLLSVVLPRPSPQPSPLKGRGGGVLPRPSPRPSPLKGRGGRSLVRRERRRPMAELRGSSGDAPNNILTRWFGTPDLHTLDVYEAEAGGYKAIPQAALDMSRAESTGERKTSGMRGRGA